MSSIDQQFVEFIAKSLVTKPDSVSIERRIDERGVLLELTVDPEDLGRVIGKHGATAQSLRTLLRALGTKNDARYNLKIVDSDRPEGERSKPAPNRSEASSDNVEHQEEMKNDSPKEEITSEESNLDEVWGKEEETPEEKPEDDEHDDMVSKTRKELAELDDLDV